MNKRPLDFESIKKRLEQDKLQDKLSIEPLVPKHTSNDVILFTESFVRFKLSPSSSTFLDFLRAYFQVKSPKRLQLDFFRSIVLKHAKMIPLLLESSLTYLVSVKSSPIPPIVSSILEAVIPWKDTEHLYKFLDETMLQFGPREQVTLLKWVQSKFESRGLKFDDLPFLSSPSTNVESLQQVLGFMEVLADIKKPLNSPFNSIFLHVQEIPKSSGEIEGILKVKLDRSHAPTAPPQIELRLSQNLTYLLGFLVSVEKSVDMFVPSGCRVPVPFFDDWTKEVQVLNKETKKGIDKLAKTLMKRMKPHVPTSIANVQLVETSKHKPGGDYVWLNTNKRSGGKNLRFVFRKRVPTKNKKPRQT